MTAKKAPKAKTDPAPADDAAAPAPAAEPQAHPAVPGDDATADELAHFIRHNSVYATLSHNERDALTRRLIAAKRAQA